MELWNSATELSLFEYKYLDNDGKTTTLEQRISEEAEICSIEWKEKESKDKIKRKY